MQQHKDNDTATPRSGDSGQSSYKRYMKKSQGLVQIKTETEISHDLLNLNSSLMGQITNQFFFKNNEVPTV